MALVHFPNEQGRLYARFGHRVDRFFTKCAWNKTPTHEFLPLPALSLISTCSDDIPGRSSVTEIISLVTMSVLSSSEADPPAEKRGGEKGSV